MSSNVSENTVAKRSIAALRSDSDMPTPPIHTFSSVPMANNAGLKFPICGLGFTTYSFDAKISRSSSKFISFTSGCGVVAGWGMFGIGGTVVLARPIRGGRCNLFVDGSDVVTDTIGSVCTVSAVVNVCGDVVVSDTSSAVCACFIFMTRRNRSRGRNSMYNITAEINTAHVNDM